MKLFRLAGYVSLIGAAATSQAVAQTPNWDNTGNGLLHGTYYFRQVIHLVGDQAGDLSRALALYGNMTFDGNGNYNISGARILDSQVGATQSFSASGTYSIAASGYGFFTDPLSTSANAYTVYGLVSNGIFVGSDTEHFNDLFIAAPVSSPLPTNSSFNGTYSMAAFLPNSGRPSTASSARFQLTADGNGNLGTVNISGYFGGGGSTVYTQSTAAVKYFFSSGAAVVTFPASTTANFYSGQEYLYFSADGNFVFGGSPVDFDFIVGVRTPVAAGTIQNFTGSYYEAGIDDDASHLAASGYSDLSTFYGAFNATGGNVIGHERVLDSFSGTQSQTYAATYPSSVVNGSYTSASGAANYVVANNGQIRIGSGVWPYLGISVAIQAPVLTGNGVFLNPAGIVNAASFAPFTAGVSSGEFIVLYGSNLAPSTQVSTVVPYPNTLNGVQVMINGFSAPLYYVSSTQIAAIVPYGITASIAQIQVINGANASNTVTEFVNKTTPGIFSLTANGIGYGAIEHADGSVVSSTHPAQPGETVAAFVSGLGAVFPLVPEGVPSTASSMTNNTITAFVGGASATVTYAGLAPFLAGLYQVNFTIPTAAVAGDNAVALAGPDSFASQTFISVGTGRASTASVAFERVRTSKPGAFVKKPVPCFVIDSACSQ